MTCSQDHAVTETGTHLYMSPEAHKGKSKFKTKKYLSLDRQASIITKKNTNFFPDIRINKYHFFSLSDSVSLYSPAANSSSIKEAVEPLPDLDAQLIYLFLLLYW